MKSSILTENPRRGYSSQGKLPGIACNTFVFHDDRNILFIFAEYYNVLNDIGRTVP